MYLGSITVESLDDKKVIVQSHVVKKSGSMHIDCPTTSSHCKGTYGGVSRNSGKKAMEVAGGYKRVWHILYKIIVEET